MKMAPYDIFISYEILICIVLCLSSSSVEMQCWLCWTIAFDNAIFPATIATLNVWQISTQLLELTVFYQPMFIHNQPQRNNQHGDHGQLDVSWPHDQRPHDQLKRIMFLQPDTEDIDQHDGNIWYKK